MKNQIKIFSVAAAIVMGTALTANASVVSALEFPTFPADWEGKMEKRDATPKLKDRFTTFSIKRPSSEKASGGKKAK